MATCKSQLDAIIEYPGNTREGGGGPGYLFLFLGTSMGSFSKQWLVIKTKNTLAMNCMGGRCSRLMVSVLDSGLGSPGLSPGRGHCVILGQDTLLSPCLSPPRSIYVQDWMQVLLIITSCLAGLFDISILLQIWENSRCVLVNFSSWGHFVIPIIKNVHLIGIQSWT